MTAAFLEIQKGTPNSGKGKGPTARSSNYKEKVLRNLEDKELARKYFKRGMEEMERKKTLEKKKRQRVFIKKTGLLRG